MSDLNQIRALETEAIECARLNDKTAMEITIAEMMMATMKYLGITNEYLEDLKQ